MKVLNVVGPPKHQRDDGHLPWPLETTLELLRPGQMNSYETHSV